MPQYITLKQQHSRACPYIPPHITTSHSESQRVTVRPNTSHYATIHLNTWQHHWHSVSKAKQKKWVTIVYMMRPLGQNCRGPVRQTTSSGHRNTLLPPPFTSLTSSSSQPLHPPSSAVCQCPAPFHLSDTENISLRMYSPSLSPSSTIHYGGVRGGTLSLITHRNVRTQTHTHTDTYTYTRAYAAGHMHA